MVIGMPKYSRTLKAADTVLSGRKATSNILHGRDDRLMVVVGPCSVHDPDAALEYARKLKEYADGAKEDLFMVMRVYFEKPRTTVGWKGLINGAHSQPPVEEEPQPDDLKRSGYGWNVLHQQGSATCQIITAGNSGAWTPGRL